MTASGPASQGGSARWVAALLISGVGLAGVGYSLATKPMPPTPPVVFVPQQVEARAGTPRPAETVAQQPSPAEVASTTPTVSSEPEPYEPAPKLDTGMTLDLNTATAEQLQLLPGIGPSRAAAIIENRTAMGPFRTVEDLARVRGIGPATVEGVRPYVTLSTPSAGGG